MILLTIAKAVPGKIVELRKSKRGLKAYSNLYQCFMEVISFVNVLKSATEAFRQKHPSKNLSHS